MKFLPFLFQEINRAIAFVFLCAAIAGLPVIAAAFPGHAGPYMLLSALVVGTQVGLICKTFAHRTLLLTLIKEKAGLQLSNHGNGAHHPSPRAYQDTIHWIDTEANPMKEYRFEVDAAENVIIYEVGKIEHVKFIMG